MLHKYYYRKNITFRSPKNTVNFYLIVCLIHLAFLTHLYSDMNYIYNSLHNVYHFENTHNIFSYNCSFDSYILD